MRGRGSGGGGRERRGSKEEKLGPYITKKWYLSFFIKKDGRGSGMERVEEIVGRRRRSLKREEDIVGYFIESFK